jgi:hypothetical protein
VTGVARPVVTQVKDAAYYRPKAHGVDGALWNDPSLHAPPVRQVLHIRPDLDQMAHASAAAKQNAQDMAAQKSRLEHMVVQRELQRQQYRDKKAERLQLEARAGQRKTDEVIEVCALACVRV